MSLHNLDTELIIIVNLCHLYFKNVPTNCNYNIFKWSVAYILTVFFFLGVDNRYAIDKKVLNMFSNAITTFLWGTLPHGGTFVHRIHNITDNVN